MSIDTSVIICTHNPRRDFLRRVLDALDDQSLSQQKWELIVVDNASERRVEEEFSECTPTNGKFIIEPKLGLTSSRIRGIEESTAAIIVFVDDDNVLQKEYLERALHISKAWPRLGAWGGQKIPGWEEAPPEWSRPYWGMLSITEFEAERWHNFSRDPSAIPSGAGLCITREVAAAYRAKVERERWRLQLDRSGRSLMSCGDFDIVFTAENMGLGVGLFPELMLTHLMPKNRITEHYLLELREEISMSLELLNAMDGMASADNRGKRHRRLKNLYYSMTMEALDYKFYKAHARGIEKAHRAYAKLQKFSVSQNA